MNDNLLPPGFKDEIFQEATLEHKYKNNIINLFQSQGDLKRTKIFFSSEEFIKFYIARGSTAVRHWNVCANMRKLTHL